MVHLLDLPSEILTLILLEVCRLEPPGNLGFIVEIRYSQVPPYLSGQQYRNHIKSHGMPKPGLQSLLACRGVSLDVAAVVDRGFGEVIKYEEKFFTEFKKWQRMEVITLRTSLYTTEECAIQFMKAGRSPYFECEGHAANLR